METFAKPIDSGVYHKIQAELLIPDPVKTVAMEIISESTRTDGDNNESDKSHST
jgi:hypothetical protein